MGRTNSDLTNPAQSSCFQPTSPAKSAKDPEVAVGYADGRWRCGYLLSLPPAVTVARTIYNASSH